MLISKIFKHMLYILLSILSITGCNKQDSKQEIENKNPDCAEFIALWSASEIAGQIGKTKKWVFMNYTVDLWENKDSNQKGKKVTAIRASSYAKIINKMDDSYLVESPIDGKQGWLDKSHVKSIVKKNVKTNALCN